MYPTPNDSQKSPPRIVVIAGPTGSGKTTLAGAIARTYPPGFCAAIALDSYYHDLAHMPLDERAKQNFDHPDTIDWALLNAHAESLLGGQAVDVPVYDFTTHTRSDRVIRISPTPIILIEGLLTLHNRSLRDVADLRIYMHIDDETGLQRRIRRDVAERGRTEGCVRAQYESTVRPMGEQFVIPSRVFADLDLNGAVPMETLLAYVKEWLPQTTG